MHDFSFDALTIEAQSRDGLVRLVWRGKSRDRQPVAVLAPYLKNAVGAAAETGKRLELCFQEIEYFNSGTVMAIVQAIHAARARGVALRIVYKSDAEWQRLSFDALRVFARDGGVEIVGSSATVDGEVRA